MELAELKSNMQFPPFIFSPTYLRIIELVFAERRLRQIAQALNMKEQNLNYYINRLVNAQILEKGFKTSYRLIKVRDDIQEQLKQKITEFKESKKNILVQFFGHHIGVAWPIIKDSGAEFGELRQRWKAKLEEKHITQNNLQYRVEKTKKNLIIRFPRGTGLKIVGLQDDPILEMMHFYCFEKAEPIKNNALQQFKGQLELGAPNIRMHYSFSDEVAKKLTRTGITMVINEGKKWVAIDKSPHFFPRGEFETNNAEFAKKYLEFFIWWAASGNTLKNFQWSSVYNLPASSPYNAGSVYPAGSAYNSETSPIISK